MIQKRHLLLLPLSGLMMIPFMPLLGCSGANPGASSGTTNAQTVDQQLKAIDNNPNMPDQAKAAAKDALLHHQDRK